MRFSTSFISSTIASGHGNRRVKPTTSYLLLERTTPAHTTTRSLRMPALNGLGIPDRGASEPLVGRGEITGFRAVTSNATGSAPSNR